jgi:hypothetical protein
MVFKLISKNSRLAEKYPSSKMFKYYNFMYFRKELNNQTISINKSRLPLDFIKFISLSKLNLKDYMVLKYLVHSFSRFLLWVNTLPDYKILFLNKNIDSFEICAGFRINLLKFFSIYSKIFRNYFLVNKVFIERNYFKEKNLLKMYTIETPSIIFKNILIIKNLNS